MRLLVSLSEKPPAMRLVSYLAVEGIQTTLEDDGDSWDIWVHHDDDREQAKSILEQFQQDPNHERYTKAERKVRNTIKEADRLVEQRQKLETRLRKRWNGSWWHCYPATYILIALCILVVVLCSKPQAPGGMRLLPLCNNQDSVLLEKLTILPQGLADVDEKGNTVPIDVIYQLWPRAGADSNTVVSFLSFRLRITLEAVWYTISTGEFWRPIGPAFIHLSLLHILFNMMWLKNLGEAVEMERGTIKFLLLCLIIAVTSNLSQLYWSGPHFGGMSGVVFGLIGYVWMKGKTQPHLGIGMTHQSITFAIFWLLLCMGGAFGAIANAAHLVGFLVGIVIGARQAIYKKLPFTK